MAIAIVSGESNLAFLDYLCPSDSGCFNRLRRILSLFDRTELMVCDRTDNGNFVTLSLRLRVGDLVMETRGVGPNEMSAKDRGARSLYDEIFNEHREMLMPKYAIGLPNFNKNCFMSVVLLLLFHSFNFIKVLLNTSEDNGERSLYWTDTLLELYKIYKRCSEKGMTFVNLVLRYGLNNEFVSEEIRSLDLLMNEKILRRLTDTIRVDFQDYNINGGSEVEFYNSLIRKLVGENPVAQALFTLTVLINYECSWCSGLTEQEFSLTMLNVDASSCINIQDYLLDWRKWLPQQGLKCRRLLFKTICGGEIRNFLNCRTIMKPELLAVCFSNIYPGNGKPMQSSPRIIFPDENWVMERIGYTCPYPVYEDGDGIRYDNNFRFPVTGDRVIGYHTVLHLRIKRGYCEIDDGIIRACNPNLKEQSRPNSLHLYARYSNPLSDLSELFN